MNRIAIDWGSSNLRAYALDPVGGILVQRERSTGIFTVSDRQFESTLRALIGDWLDIHPRIEICAAGMIGSVNGWQEARYVCAPAGVDDLRARCISIPFENSTHVLRVVPGVRHGEGDDTDVMRGEETQIFGVLGAETRGVFCLPGTHCKWVVVHDGKIVDFRTHYSGELYQWLSTQSSVGKVLDAAAPFDEAAFDAGAARAAAAPDELLRQLFTLRASVVARERSGAQNASALQGLVIGNDVFSGLSYLRRRFASPQNIQIIGAPALCARYARALAAHHVQTTSHASDATVNGLTRIFRDVA